jgi:hypothetical protein
MEIYALAVALRQNDRHDRVIVDQPGIAKGTIFREIASRGIKLPV